MKINTITEIKQCEINLCTGGSWAHEIYNSIINANTTSEDFKVGYVSGFGSALTTIGTMFLIHKFCKYIRRGGKHEVLLDEKKM